ncbi:ABC-type cobalamin/Fe3+-siderophores [Zymobacter palmae]|uniref:ABC-type cobalamin/Fe3+-siderophores n=1 Tax=Zymobacter palmae TaxID=33074 RepID=A0A348HF79_9GAMM|nr:ABC-type cobalamin/Fe3+-siderophores [Zymobacter palmae]
MKGPDGSGQYRAMAPVASCVEDMQRVIHSCGGCADRTCALAKAAASAMPHSPVRS